MIRNSSQLAMTATSVQQQRQQHKNAINRHLDNFQRQQTIRNKQQQLRSQLKDRRSSSSINQVDTQLNTFNGINQQYHAILNGCSLE
jgi:septation ring formation regulator EzrA